MKERPAKKDQVRGKKNLVVERSLAGTVGLFVKFSTLQEYGVDKIFFLENHNVDSSQRNVIFLVRGEKAKTVRTVAGMSSDLFQNSFPLFSGSKSRVPRLICFHSLYSVLIPKANPFTIS